MLKKLLQSILRYEQAERLRGLVCDGILYSGLGWMISRQRPRGATVLLYHSVAGADIFTDNVISESAFDSHMRFIRENRQPVPLSWIVEALVERRTPDRTWVAVTFDDGYKDFFTKALPILERHGVPASLFVPTTILAGQELFFDEIERLVHGFTGGEIVVSLASEPLRLPVSSRLQRRDASLRIALILRQMDPVCRESGLEALRAACRTVRRAGPAPYVSSEDLRLSPDWVEIGSHSVGHFCLAELDDEQLERELTDSVGQLAAICGRSVDCLAYPFGKPWSFDPRVMRAAAASGYRSALTTIPGPVLAGTDRFAIPRYAGSGSLSRLRLNLMGLSI